MRPQNIDRNSLAAEGTNVSGVGSGTGIELGVLWGCRPVIPSAGDIVVSACGMLLTACVLGHVVSHYEVVTAKLAHAAYDEGRELGSTVVVGAMALRADDD